MDYSRAGFLVQGSRIKIKIKNTEYPGSAILLFKSLVHDCVFVCLFLALARPAEQRDGTDTLAMTAADSAA